MFFAILPDADVPEVLKIFSDKFLHGASYFVLFLLGVLAFESVSAFKIAKHPFIFAFLWCLTFGIITEFLQQYVPGRSSDFHDFIADLTGALCAVLALKLVEILKHYIEKRA